MGYVDESGIVGALFGRKIVAADTVDNGTDDTRGYLTLDNGVVLEVVGNEGCGGCSNGWYYVSEVATCDNLILGVEFEEELNSEDRWEESYIYRIFVLTANEKIKVVQVDGSDGNGYYGTGYHVNVKVPV